MDYYFAHQLGPDGEPLPNASPLLSDEIAALIEQQRRSFWDHPAPDADP